MGLTQGSLGFLLTKVLDLTIACFGQQAKNSTVKTECLNFFKPSNSFLMKEKKSGILNGQSSSSVSSSRVNVNPAVSQSSHS